MDKIAKRKAETRRKIELGGLVRIARLDVEDTRVILGGLLFLKQELDQKPHQAREHFAHLGKAYFDHGQKQRGG